MVKAFNNIYAAHLMEFGKPAGTPGRIALPVGGDQVPGKEVVFRLLDERDLTASTLGASMIHGASSLGHRCSALTLTLTVSDEP